MMLWLAVLACFHFSVCNSQPLFEVDTLTRQIKDKLPFDKDFFLKIKDKDKSLTNVHVYKLFIKKGKISPTRTSLVKQIEKGELLFSPSFTYSGDYAFIKMDPLDPNTPIDLGLIHKFTGKPLKDLIKVFALMHQGKLDDAKALKSRLLNKIENQVPGFPITAFGGRGWGSKSDEKLIDFYTDILKPLFSSVQGFTYTIDLQKISHENLHKLDSEGFKLSIDTSPLQKLGSLEDNGMLEDIMRGLADPEDIPGSPKEDALDLYQRIDNLKKSEALIRKVVFCAEKIMLRSTSSGPARMKTEQLRKVEQKLVENRKFLEESLGKISKKIEEEENLRYCTWFSGDNHIYDLKTAGSYFLIPAIGLVSIFTRGNESNKVFVRPYVGAAIYLRPVDKNQPIKYLKNKFLHRFSLNLGLTVTALKGGNEFSDLYNNMSLLTGANYKLTRAVSLSLGAVWLKQADKNPLLDKPKSVPQLYFSVAFDVDFMNSISKLTGKLSL